MKTKFRRRGVWSLAVLAIGFALAGGIAHAALSESAGTINACRANGSGLLRVVDEQAACKATETPLSWSSGPMRPTQFITRFGTVELVDPGRFGSPHALCAAGEQAVAGQFSGQPGMELIASLPVRSFPDLAFADEGDVGIGWRFTFRNTTEQTASVQARVICASQG